jgi:pimeloyl-ACP methyl ester carboxylesterase
LVGQHDLVGIKRDAEQHSSIRNAQMSIVPNASHVANIDTPDFVNTVLLFFLKA